MADFINDIDVPSNDWVDVYTLTGFSVGVGLIMQNKGPSDIFMWVGAVKPAADSSDGFVLKDHRQGSSAVLDSGESGLWVRAKKGDKNKLHVQAS